MIVWLIFILVEAYRNWYVIEVHKSRPNYLQSFIIRGMAAILHGVFMDETTSLDLFGMKDYLPLFILQITSFWILFDPILNILRGKSILYTGDPTPGSSGWLDRLPVSLYWILKAIALITLIYIL